MIPIIDRMSNLRLSDIVTPKQTETGSMIPSHEGQRGIVVSPTPETRPFEVVVAWFNGGTTICLERSLVKLTKKN